jgi:hypothetical protein
MKENIIIEKNWLCTNEMGINQVNLKDIHYVSIDIYLFILLFNLYKSYKKVIIVTIDFTIEMNCIDIIEKNIISVICKHYYYFFISKKNFILLNLITQSLRKTFLFLLYFLFFQTLIVLS